MLTDLYFLLNDLLVIKAQVVRLHVQYHARQCKRKLARCHLKQQYSQPPHLSLLVVRFAIPELRRRIRSELRPLANDLIMPPIFHLPVKQISLDPKRTQFEHIHLV